MAAHRPALPFLLACAGIACFSLMDAFMKGVTLQAGAYNAMLWRNLCGVGIAGLLYLPMRKPWPAPHVARLHIWRGALGGIMALLFFYAIARLPIAETIALSFIAPLIALYLAAILLGETVQPRVIAASLLGLAGVIVIVAARLGRSEYDAEAIHGLVAITLSALIYAYNLILARRQALVALPREIAFFQFTTSTAMLMLAAPFLAILPGADTMMGAGISALLAVAALLLLSWAYARAEAQTLIPVEYTAFIWAMLFGWWMFDEHPTLPMLIGTALIVAGSFIAARARPKRKRVAVEPGLS